MKWLVPVILLLFVSCGKEGKYEEVEFDLGYKGTARINPYLAAERFLKTGGWEASSSRVWSDFDTETATIIMPGSFLSTKGMGMRVLEWVEEGGMLVVALEGGEGQINDFNRDHWMDLAKEEEYRGLDHLLDKLGITLEGAEFDTVPVEEGETGGHLEEPWNVAEVWVAMGDEEYDMQIEFEGTTGMRAPQGETWDGEEVSRMVTASHGDGKVMVLAHARPFRNAYLARSDHAIFLELVANWHYGGDVVFLYGSGSSFKDLIWQHAWQVVIAGLVLLFVWLWMRIPRFGPIKEDDFTYRKPYGEGLKAAAKFLWRKKALGHLVRPLRSNLERYNSNESGVLYEKLAAESDLQIDDVIEAMTSENFQDPGTVTRMVRKLQILTNR
jgi:hypothetical protein